MWMLAAILDHVDLADTGHTTVSKQMLLGLYLTLQDIGSEGKRRGF